MRRCSLLAFVVITALYACVRTPGAKLQPEPASTQHHSAPQHHETHHTVTHRRVLHSGSSVDRRAGKVVGFHDAARHIDMHRNLSGGRRITIERADGAHITAEYGRGGYVQHPYTWRGHSFYLRTYYRFGRPGASRFYRGYRWHGIGLHVWRPRYFYRRAFYDWLHRPWLHVRYRWPWFGRPWYTRYSNYHQPYVQYDDVSEWLTDYVLSADLQDEDMAYYLQHQPSNGAPAAAAPPPGIPPTLLTDDVKHQLDAEIRYELAQEEQAAQQDAAGTDSDTPAGIAAVFADTHPHVFLVSHPVDADDPDYPDGCMIATGDLLRTTTPPEEGDTTAEITVIGSRGGDKACAINSTVSVDLDELQEMQNDLRVRIQEGLDVLRKQQGTNGLPALDPDANGTVNARYTTTAPPPDRTAWTDIGAAYKEADAGERDVTAEEEKESTATPPETPTQQPPAPIERR